MDSQPTLDLYRRPGPTENPPTAPLLWIEEVRLLKTLSPDPSEHIREPITFQKGLNIIWAPAPPMKERKQVNFAGHAAGKTTLCRLLRYLLGEKHTAAPGVKEAIADTFPMGWIVGKIHIGEQTWIIARPLHPSTRPRSRCIQAESIDDLLQDPQNTLTDWEYKTALSQHVIDPLPVKLFGDGTTEITIDHVLQWFTRDQDCHLTKLHEFRHTDSKSDSPFLTAEASHFLQRIILNLADNDLREAITNCEKLESEDKKFPLEKDYLIRRENELNDLLEHAKVKKANTPKLTEITTCIAREECKKIETAALKKTTDAIEIAKKTKKEISETLPALREQLGTYKQKVVQAEADQKEAQERLASLNGKNLDLKVEKENAKKRPPSAYCRVPREQASGCPHFHEWDVLSDTEEGGEKQIHTEKQATEKYLKICTSNLASLNKEKDTIAGKILSGENTIKAIKLKIEDFDTKLEEKQRPFDTTRTQIDDLEEIIKKLERLNSREKTLKNEVVAAKSLQEKLQKRHKKTEEKFIDEYAWIIAQIIGGEDTKTKCTFTRKKITSTISYHDKDLTSAAVTALKTLCFDIAAMNFSSRGYGYHPRFVIHDSPREADMGEAPYGRIFDLIVQQANSSLNFQHIITTTTEPPAEYQELPHLRLKLDSTEPSGKLFKQDL